jgi:signal transduction histidine kinase
VSRAHAALQRQADGGFAIKDLDSSHGTFVNNERVSLKRLSDGATFRVGDTWIEFRLSSSGARPRGAARPLVPADRDGGFTVLDVLADETVGDDVVTPLSGVSGPSAYLADHTATSKRLSIAYELSEFIASTSDLDALCRKILDAIFATVRVERAAILLVDKSGREIEVKASKDAAGAEQAVPYSNTIVQNVIETGRSLLLANAQEEQALKDAKSVFAQDIRSAMCVPIRTRERIIGAINADASGAALFTKEDLLLLTLVGNEAGIAIQNARLYEENLKAERLAAVGQTVASLAHCIKNILSGLKGGSFMIDEGLKSSNAELVTAGWPIVKDSQTRITELVMNMLDYSKERQPAYERADLREHMQNIRELMESRAQARGVSLKLEFDPATPAIECDPMAVYRAALNLVTNAIDAAPAETGKVVFRVRPDEARRRVLISVADNGPGIPPAVRARLFEAFQSTKSSRGTGLGLAVTKKIAEEHHGEIQVETKEGAGTRFTIRLPVDRPA